MGVCLAGWDTICSPGIEVPLCGVSTSQTTWSHDPVDAFLPVLRVAQSTLPRSANRIVCSTSRFVVCPSPRSRCHAHHSSSSTQRLAQRVLALVASRVQSPDNRNPYVFSYCANAQRPEHCLHPPRLNGLPQPSVGQALGMATKA